jgi:hypothetical protein
MGAYICYNIWSAINPMCSWLNVLYVLSTVKVIITCLKFLPQVLLNHKRKATRGWNIYGTWLDLVGSVLSCAQLIFDCMDRDDYSGISGNIVKLMLGLVSGKGDSYYLSFSCSVERTCSLLRKCSDSTSFIYAHGAETLIAFELNFNRVVIWCHCVFFCLNRSLRCHIYHSTLHPLPWNGRRLQHFCDGAYSGVSKSNTKRATSCD